jgi:hypothetical protein
MSKVGLDQVVLMRPGQIVNEESRRLQHQGCESQTDSKVPERCAAPSRHRSSFDATGQSTLTMQQRRPAGKLPLGVQPSTGGRALSR